MLSSTVSPTWLMSFPSAGAQGFCTATGTERDCEREKTYLQRELAGVQRPTVIPKTTWFSFTLL